MKKEEVKEEITIRNTKAEILDALNEALKREKEIQKIKSNPELEIKEKIKEKAIKETKVNIEKNIFSEELIKKFNDLEFAIESEEEKLKNLYGIEKELNNLTLVINAGKDYLMKLEIEKKNKQEELSLKINSLEEEYNNKVTKLQEEYDLKAKSLKLEREREIEEYNYKIKREREINTNKWEDEKKIREEKLKEKEMETNKLLEEVKNNSDNYKELEKKVNEIPELLIKEYQKGVTEATNSLEKDNKYTTELLKKDYQNTIDRQTDKIKSLEEELAKLTNSNNELLKKTDNAYKELKELATKTVETNGAVKIISNENKPVA